MKKIWFLFLFIALLAVGCSNNDASTDDVSDEDAEETTAVDEEEESDEEDEDIVTLVLPAFLKEDGLIESAIEELNEAGATTTEENSDGSVTVEISQEGLDSLLEKYHQEIVTAIEEIDTTDSESSIKDLSYDEETYQEFNLTVDKQAYESDDNMDGLILFSLSMQSIMYQVYSGVDEADIQVTFNLIDESTGEIFSTEVFPTQ